MKKYIFLLLGITIFTTTYSQIQNPVKWSFSAKKLDAKTYEVHFTASIEPNWHIYSQATPDGGPVPTTFKFSNNPLVTLHETVKEVGKLEKHFEKLFGIDVLQFSKKVDFIQVVKLRSPVKTNVSGSLEFMACNDEQCLPPAIQKFTIALK